MTPTKNTDKLRREVAEHVAADSIAQGVYWDAEHKRGCFIGCLNHSDNPAGAEQRFGLPIMVQRIAENIFESLPAAEAKAFFAALPDAVRCDGKDLTRVGWQFLAAELRSLPAQSAEIQAVIDPVIAGMDTMASGQEWAEAWAAATRAARAARAAAADAAWAARVAAAAARAAWTAADAADAAVWAAAADAAWAAQVAAADAAWAAQVAAARAAARAAADAADAAWATPAARAAARLRQRDLLLRLIADAPVVGGAQ